MDSTEEHTSPKPHSLRLLALTGAFALLTAGCGLVGGDAGGPGGGEDEGGDSARNSGGGEPSELPVSTTVTSHDDHDLELEVRALERIGDGVLRLTMGVHNHSDDDVRMLHSLENREHRRARRRRRGQRLRGR